MQKKQTGYPQPKEKPRETTVYTISEREIKSTGRTQCTEHKWEKLNDNEIICRACNTVLIINPDCLDEYVK
jgi:hypothetical protein